MAKDLQTKIAHAQAAKGITQNAPISDETFLRRVYLDVVGRIPSPNETQRFLADKATDKRATLIDALLNSEGYVSHTFNWKADQLRVVSGGLSGQPGWLYDDWVKNSIRSGQAHRLETHRALPLRPPLHHRRQRPTRAGAVREV